MRVVVDRDFSPFPPLTLPLPVLVAILTNLAIETEHCLDPVLDLGLERRLSVIVTVGWRVVGVERHHHHPPFLLPFQPLESSLFVSQSHPGLTSPIPRFPVPLVTLPPPLQLLTPPPLGPRIPGSLCYEGTSTGYDKGTRALISRVWSPTMTQDLEAPVTFSISSPHPRLGLIVTVVLAALMEWPSVPSLVFLLGLPDKGGFHVLILCLWADLSRGS